MLIDQKVKKAEYYKKNSEIILANKREYYKDNKEKISKRAELYYKDNKKKISKRAKSYYKNNPGKHYESSKRWYEKNPEKKSESSWRRQGIKNEKNENFTIIDFFRFAEIQKWNCAICLKHIIELKGELVVDHCHKIGIVRGLVCHRCNTALSYLEEKDFFDKAKSYLTQFNKLYVK